MADRSGAQQGELQSGGSVSGAERQSMGERIRMDLQNEILTDLSLDSSPVRNFRRFQGLGPIMYVAIQGLLAFHSDSV